MIDTLRLSRRLPGAGMTRDAAEALREGLAEAVEAGVAAMLLAHRVVVRRLWSA